MEKEDSDYIWDLDYACDSLEYDAENDCYIVAEGWYESVSFADEFNRIVDETVIAWRPIMEPYQAGNY